MLKYQHTNTTLKKIYKKDFSYKTAITLNNNKKFKRKAKYNKKNKNTRKQKKKIQQKHKIKWKKDYAYIKNEELKYPKLFCHYKSYEA